MTGSSLQINMAPLDIRHIVHTLPHQLRALGGQVDEIQFTLDNHHSRVGRYATDDYTQKHAELRRYLERVCEEVPKARIVDVDYAPSALAEVAAAFMGADFVPVKAYNGSPFHAYLYGVLHCRHDYVLHIDSDMLFGGGSQEWVAETIEFLKTHKDVTTAMPLDGPPKANKEFEIEPGIHGDLRISHYTHGIGTRIFFLDRRRFLSGEDRVPLVRVTGRRRLKSYLYGSPPYLPLEDCMTVAMEAQGSWRAHLLGSGEGLWHLHPPYRSERFYRELPELIARIESNDIPVGQQGDHNINDSMVDWSDVRQRATFWRGLRRQVRFVAINMSERARG